MYDVLDWADTRYMYMRGKQDVLNDKAIIGHMNNIH